MKIQTILRESFHPYRFILPVTVGVFALLVGLCFHFGARPEDFLFLIFMPGIGLSLALMPLCVMSFLIFFRSIWDKSRGEAGSLTASQLFDHRFKEFLTLERFMKGIPGVFVIVLLAAAVAIGKSMLPFVTDYKWDPLFSEWDRILHFGRYPYEYILPLIKALNLADQFNRLYVLVWIGGLHVVGGWCLFCDPSPQRRMRYLWSMVVVWLFGGIVLAMLCASVGPIYFHDFYPDMPDPYAPLLSYLRSVYDVAGQNVISISQMLLTATRDATPVNPSGISAMPSMHNASVWLVVLYAFSWNRIAGWGAFIFFMLILTGSVYLGWHYAIDGYAGAALSSLVWWGMGRFYRDRPQKTLEPGATVG